jgi:hypothetical protein
MKQSARVAFALVAFAVSAIGAFAIDARAGVVIEDQKPVPFRTAPVTLSSSYALSSGGSVSPGSVVLEVTLVPAVRPQVHGVVSEDLVVHFFQVDPATKALTLRGSQWATVAVTNPEPGRKYSLRDLGFAQGHAVTLETKQGGLHGTLAGKNAVIHFVLTPAPAATR